MEEEVGLHYGLLHYTTVEGSPASEHTFAVGMAVFHNYSQCGVYNVVLTSPLLTGKLPATLHVFLCSAWHVPPSHLFLLRLPLVIAGKG